MAAGMSLPEGNLATFRIAFAAEIAARADHESLTGVIHSDGALTLDELSLDTARVLRGAGPWGQGFAEPVFDGDFQVVDARIVGGKHLKLQLKMADVPNGVGDGSPIEAIAFGYVGAASEDPQVRSGAQMRGGSRIQAAYRLEINDYRGIERLQLNCQHLRLA
jgi:single-stranded-DNA-specific exonuclease